MTTLKNTKITIEINDLQSLKITLENGNVIYLGIKYMSKSLLEILEEIQHILDIYVYEEDFPVHYH
jgi:cell division septal protein FtsQ